MNLYIRFFNKEFLAHNIDEAIAFLNSIPDVHVDDALKEDLTSFAENAATYPKRYKIKPRVYFIVIKTTAETMEEFKAKSKKDESASVTAAEQAKNERLLVLTQNNPGWYEGSLTFKRVIPIPGTGKFQYRDTLFVARVKANNPEECYSKIIHHLRNRQDVDLRSQFPSVRGKKFSYKYLGEELPQE